jgi:hypothetical protein
MRFFSKLDLLEKYDDTKLLKYARQEALLEE